MVERKFLGADVAGHLFEHRVREAVAAAEGLRELDRFVEHDAVGRLRRMRKLVGAEIENRALNERDALQISVDVLRKSRFGLLGVKEHAREERFEELAVRTGEVVGREVRAVELLARLIGNESLELRRDVGEAQLRIG